MRIFFLSIFLLPIGVFAQHNYVKKTEFKIPGVHGGNYYTINAADKIETYTYYDGLGRPKQNVAVAQSPTGNSIITPIKYDNRGRQVLEFLSYPATTATSSFQDEAAIAAGLASYPPYTDQNAYSEKLFEDSPLNRVLKQAAPGYSWAMGNGAEIKFEYQTNSTSEVRLFKATSSLSGSASSPYEISLVEAGTSFYPANELFKVITKNENWTSGDENTTQEFTNKEGKPVLKRKYGTSVVNGVETSSWHSTYYVYDQFGNLTYVIPPLAADSAITPQILENLCYQYKYDRKNRLVEKKLPGKQWEFIVYDRVDRVVATGPAFSPFGDGTVGWLINKYDIQNRIVYTGWYEAVVTSSSRTSLQQDKENVVTNPNIHETRLLTDYTIDNITVSYSNDVLPQTFKLLSVKYYDRYNFPSTPSPFPTTVMSDGSQAVKYNINYNYPIGLETGAWVRIVETSSQVNGEISYYLYDSNDRVVRTWSKNHLQGISFADSKYDFMGKLMSQESSHQRTPSDTSILIKEDFTYTPDQRLSTHTHKINSNPTELLSKHEYDPLGGLITKRIGGLDTNGATSLQKIDYAYNIRGWLTDINGVEEIALGGPITQSSDPEDLFKFKIHYENPSFSSVLFDPGGTPLFNGNISETEWRTRNDNVRRRYRYFYDDFSRLELAQYERPEISTPVTNSYNESLKYDKNGNITFLQRNGEYDDSLYYLEIDNLTYTYNSSKPNQLLKVVDSTNNNKGFKDGTNSGDDYSYDIFENLYEDKNKGITAIFYNHLNLPVKIEFGANHINYFYNASGKKVGKIWVNGNATSSADYLNGFQYTDGELDFFPTSEGSVEVSNPGSGYVFNYIYNYLDHLGNIRMRYGLNPVSNEVEVLEENNYYPFGLQHKNYNMNRAQYNRGGVGGIEPCLDCPETYNYKYNGKEWQDELGLNFYDYGARNYDPAIGRFMNIDRMAEMFERMTPYQYAGNTPTYFIDRNGEYIDINDPNGTDKYRYQNGQTQKRQADGSYKTIDASENLSDFVLQTIAGLNGLENSGKTGKGMIDAFSGDKKNVTFEYTQGKGPEANSTTGKITLDPTSANKSWTTEGYTATPLFVALGHEMEHIASKNSTNYDTWYKPGVTKGEIGASHIENKIRAESGLPLRVFYGGNSKGPFEMSRLIDNKGNSIYYNSDGGRYLYPNTSQTQQTQATINDVNKANKGVILNSRYNYNENR